MSGRVYSLCLLAALLCGLGLTSLFLSLHERHDRAAVTKGRVESAEAYIRRQGHELAAARQAVAALTKDASQHQRLVRELRQRLSEAEAACGRRQAW